MIISGHKNKHFQLFCFQTYSKLFKHKHNSPERPYLTYKLKAVVN